MGKSKKSTKKFQQKRLPAVLAARRKRKSVQQQRSKRHRGRQEEHDGSGEGEEGSGDDEDAEEEDEIEQDPEREVAGRGQKRKAAEMSTDDFMARGLDASSSDEEGDADDADEPMADEEQDDADADAAAPSASKHKKQLEKLRKTDPEFYQYMQKHDKELLEFDGSDEDEEDEDEGGKGGKAAGAKGKGKKGPKALDADSDEDDEAAGADEGDAELEEEQDDGRSGDVLKGATLNEWIEQLNAAYDGSKAIPRAVLKEIVAAFRSACHISDADPPSDLKYNIVSAEVFNNLMLYSLRTVDALFGRMLKLEGADPKTSVSAQAGWKHVGTLVKVHIQSLLFMAGNITADDMLVLVVNQLGRMVPYLAVFPQLARKALKVVLPLWGGDHELLRVRAFLTVRDMAIRLPYPFIDAVLKSAYKTYVRNAKFTSDQSLPRIQFLTNCMVELYGLDPISSYQHMFVYIRQLAIHLRNALTLKTKNAFQTVYNWQFINSLRVWSAILSNHTESNDLKPLVYPLVQICLGVVRLIPTSRYCPLRFTVVRFLNDLGTTGTYIPVAPILLEALEFSNLGRKVHASKDLPPDMIASLKVGKTAVGTRSFQDAVVAHVSELMLAHFASLSTSVAFPELIIPAVLRLRRFCKTTKVQRFKKSVQWLVERLEAQAKWLAAKRDAAGFAPRDTDQIASFLKGASTPLKKEYQTFMVQKKKREALEAGQRAAAAAAVGKKGRGGDDDSSSLGEPDEPLDDNGGAGGEDNDEEDDEEEAPEPTAKRQKLGNTVKQGSKPGKPVGNQAGKGPAPPQAKGKHGKGKQPARDDVDMADADDVVEAMNLSDLDDD